MSKKNKHKKNKIRKPIMTEHKNINTGSAIPALSESDAWRKEVLSKIKPIWPSADGYVSGLRACGGIVCYNFTCQHNRHQHGLRDCILDNVQFGRANECLSYTPPELVWVEPHEIGKIIREVA